MGIPDTVFFRTKTQIAMSLTDRALEHGVRPAFPAADSGYGESGEFRESLRQRKLPSFPSVVSMIVLEVATQELMNKRRMTRKDARPTAELMLKVYSDW